jgi:molecular chaperone DnaK
VILIGGATKTPLLRRVLADRLGIPLDHTIDPRFAVVLGAAVYATP